MTLIRLPKCSPGFVLSCLAALLAASVATAAIGDEPAINETPDTELEIRLHTGVWLARLGGESRLRQSDPRTLDFNDDLDLRDLEATFNAELNIRKHDFFDIHLSGFSFSTDASGTYRGRASTFGEVTLNEGDPYRASFDMMSFNGELRLPIHRPFVNSDQKFNSDGRKRVRFRFGPTIGVRYLEVNQRVERVGDRRESTGGEWMAVHGGIHFDLMFRPDIDFPLFDRFCLEAAVSVGPAFGGDHGLMWQVQSNFRVHVTENFGVMVGYRLIELDVKNDGYELTGGLQGLFVAGTISF